MARDLRQHILQTASELFYRQGINTTGVDAIVKAAGTTKMSLYKYFPSKDDLVVAHLERSRAALQQRLMGLIAQAESPRAKLLAVFDTFAALQADPAFRGCPFINASAEFAAESSPIQRAAADFSASFRHLLADLVQQAGVSQADKLASQLSMLIAGAMVREQMQRQSNALANARDAAEILLEYYENLPASEG